MSNSSRDKPAAAAPEDAQAEIARAEITRAEIARAEIAQAEITRAEIATPPDTPAPPFCFDVLTLMPGVFEGFSREGLIGKALADGLLRLRTWDWRQHATDRHGTVDDAPFGGGAGMVLKLEPLVAGLRQARAQAPAGAPVVLLTPAGRPFDQAMAARWSQGPGLVLVCGRYEGFDARIEAFADELVSIGDYVLNGGEVAAMAIVEAVGRLKPGVLGNAASIDSESHAPATGGLLEYPHYTRPRSFEGVEVPEVLLSGDHARIAAWRKAQSEARTRALRPDLLPPDDPGA